MTSQSSKQPEFDAIQDDLDTLCKRIVGTLRPADPGSHEPNVLWLRLLLKPHIDRLAELERKRGACEVCWTVSWEPIKKESDADGVNTIGPDHLARCGYCWHEKAYQDRLATVEKERDKYKQWLTESEQTGRDNLVKLAACEARLAQMEADLTIARVWNQKQNLVNDNLTRKLAQAEQVVEAMDSIADAAEWIRITALQTAHDAEKETP